MDGDCIFCKIVKKEIPADIVYEDNDFIAFMDIAPVNKGHVLLVPKKHYETFLDMPNDLISKGSVILKKVSEAVIKGTNAEGLNVTTNIYEAAGQLVKHTHFHIIPRWKNDGLKMWGAKKYEEGEMEEFRKKIEDKIE